MSDSISNETRQKIIYAIALINDSKDGFETIRANGKLTSPLRRNATMGMKDLKTAREIL